MFKRILLFAIAMMMVALPAFASVTDEIKVAVDRVIKIVSDKEMKKPANEQKRRTAIKQAIGTVFNHQEMARRSLGRHWNSRSKEEQRQFVELFANLLENSYAEKIESYNNEKIVYLREIVDSDYAEVKSKVVGTKNDEYTLDYKALKKDGKWMVYDVVIEGVSLVSNYRTQFNKIISANGYGELLKKLQLKNDEIQ
ncbi:MAG: ABC transporter substrate-binding protein [Trichlorobacter sp.]|nr:ABC transporter substrate-binding protein [Trichlorobacter sp.]